jgi:2-polyprenyl-3-methyl-5-hydroxy-6-metoxy-1,4-benzoquinol methylase
MNGRPCVLCSGTEFRFVVTGYDRMQARSDDFDYVRCLGCGLHARAQLPEPEQIPDLYPSNYLSIINSWKRDLDKPVNRLAIKYLYGVDSVSRPRLARAVFRLLSGRIMHGIQEPYGANRLLDVGCGSGEALEVYRRLGWRVGGIEISQQAGAACREKGLDVHQGTVFDAPFSTQGFDVILLSHVIEHVLDPVAVLRRVAEFLAPQGKIVVTTPNTRGIGFLIYGSCWLALDAPRHIFLFDTNTIRLLATRAGLAVSRLLTQSSSQTLAESRHYSKTQGRRLPRGFADRQALLRESARRREAHRVYRDLMSPLAYFSSLFGKGDILEAELRALFTGP